jgi:hypothetical protein
VLERLLDELRLDGRAYAHAEETTLLRRLALEKAWQQGVRATPAAVDAAIGAFRRERGLLDAGEFARWRQAQHLDDDVLTRLMEDEAQVRLLKAGQEREVASGLADSLRLAGEYGRLLARAQDKQEFLEASGLQNPALEDGKVTEDELLRWYFETRLGRPVAPDVRAYARSQGFEDEADFRRALLREFLYTARTGC